MKKESTSITEQQVCVYLLQQYGSFNFRSFSSLTEKKQLQILRAGHRGANSYIRLLNLYVIVDKVRFSRMSPEEQQKVFARGRRELAKVLAKQRE